MRFAIQSRYDGLTRSDFSAAEKFRSCPTSEFRIQAETVALCVFRRVRVSVALRRHIAVAAVAALGIAGCAPHGRVPPLPVFVPESGDSADVALARALAPVLYVQRDEPFPLERVVAVLHPTRPIIAYHLLWRHDINGQWVPWAKPSDEEEVWVGYDRATHAPTDLWTYWHGTILHASTRGAPATVAVQWGKHGSLPKGVAEGGLPRAQTLNVFYALEFLLIPDMILGKIVHGGPVGFFHTYRRYRDFSTVLPLAGRLDAVVRAEDVRPSLRTVFGRIYSNKRWWPADPPRRRRLESAPCSCGRWSGFYFSSFLRGRERPTCQSWR